MQNLSCNLRWNTDSDTRNEYRRRIVIKIILACCNQMCLFRYPLLLEAQGCLLLHSNTKKLKTKWREICSAWSQASQFSTTECYLYLVASCGEGTDCKKRNTPFLTLPCGGIKRHQDSLHSQCLICQSWATIGLPAHIRKNMTDHADVCCGAATSNDHSNYY